MKKDNFNLRDNVFVEWFSLCAGDAEERGSLTIYNQNFGPGEGYSLP